MISHCGLICTFLVINDVEHFFFNVPIGHLCFLWKNVYSHLLYNLFLKNLYLFACLFMTALVLRCGERGLLFVAVHGLLIVVASFVVEHGF